MWAISVSFAPLVFFLDSFHFFFGEIVFDIEMLKRYINFVKVTPYNLDGISYVV